MAKLSGKNIERQMKMFLGKKGKDTDFLEKHDIGVIYGDCENSNLTKVHKNVYLYYGLPSEVTYSPP